MRKRHVLQLTGSPKDTFHEQLSLAYARDCEQALGSDADFIFLHTRPGGQHLILSSLHPQSIKNAKPITLGQAIETICMTQPELALPQMFCREGMTTYRSLLDLVGVSYIGNLPHTMALTFDKARTRSIVSVAGVRVPTGLVIDFNSPSWQSPSSHTDAFSRFEFPVIVKPSCSDNSMGVTLVDDAESLGEAISHAAEFSTEVLVEQFIAPGREVRCGVIDVKGELKCLPLQEYDVSGDHPIRLPPDKVTKNLTGDVELTSRLKSTSHAVSLEDPATETVHDLARKAHIALGCRHYSLFDFRIDDDGQPWFLEAGLYCSFANSSVIATMASYDSIELRDLFSELAQQSQEKELQPC
ncbi:MAG: D-alanine--D-alanine ligase [Planctomycetota bacterium]